MIKAAATSSQTGGTSAQATTDEDSTVTFVLRQMSGGNQVLGRFRLAATTNAAVARAPKATLPGVEIAELLKTPQDKRTEEEKQKLGVYHRSAAPELIEQRRQLAEAKKAKADFEGTVPRCLVSVAEAEPRVVRILPRGDFMDESGEIVLR